MNITETILILRDKYIKENMSENSTYWDINNGDCENFAVYVLKHLTNGKETDDLYMLTNYNFLKNNKWDKELLEKYWENVIPLNDISWDKLNKINFGQHIWLTDGKYHYDAEMPEGTLNFFNLPIFSRRF